MLGKSPDILRRSSLNRGRSKLTSQKVHAFRKQLFSPCLRDRDLLEVSETGCPESDMKAFHFQRGCFKLLPSSWPDAKVEP